jgi:enoyl-CoA hydratase/carnithine racemase
MEDKTRAHEIQLERFVTSEREIFQLSMPSAGVALVEIDHPPVNALDRVFHESLSAFVAEIEADRTVRAVVFASSHESIFLAGADLKTLRLPGSRAETADRVDRAGAAFLRLQRLPQPTIAAIEGHALGGGCEFALVADFRFMSRGRARIGLPEAALGLIPAGGGTQRLSRLIGRSRAADMMMLARRLDADEAGSVGLVTPCDDARDAALEYAAALAAMPANALRLIKECLNDGYDEDLLRGLRVERTAAIEGFAHHDAVEGVAAFLEKRPPSFDQS